MIDIRVRSNPSPEPGYAIFFRDHAAKILILVTLLAVWCFGASSSFVPCVQDCGETFVAAHAVTNDRLYGMKYGQLHDSATIPDPERRPFLYSHNINLGSLVYVFLDRVGLTSLWEKQLITLLAFGAGLYYVFLTVRHVTRSYVAALVVLFLFCTEYAQVLTFGLNALRAWHWLAFFGLVFHVLQYVSAEKKSCAADLFGISLFIAIAMAVGYEFLGIIGLITFLVTILCTKSWRRTVTFAVSWIPSSVAGFTRNWVAGIQPGRESAILERINHGQPPFTESDLLEVNLANREEIEKYQLLRPDYWLYYATDEKLEVQSVAPSCNRSYARRLWDDLTSTRSTPRLAGINFDAPAGAGTFAGELTVTGRAVASVEIRYGEILLARVGLGCDLGKFSGALVSMDFPLDTIPVKVDAVSHSGERYRLGESTISLQKQRVAKPSSQPRRQPAAEDLIRLNRTLPIAAEGAGFVLFDLRPLWKR